MNLNQEMFVAVNDQGKAVSRRFHISQDCSTLRSEEGKVKLVNTEEQVLLGLRVCSVCEKRKTGGPAIDVLEGFFHDVMHGELTPRDAAWSMFEYLRDHNGYIAFRKPKDESNE